MSWERPDKLDSTSQPKQPAEITESKDYPLPSWFENDAAIRRHRRRNPENTSRLEVILSAGYDASTQILTELPAPLKFCGYFRDQCLRMKVGMLLSTIVEKVLLKENRLTAVEIEYPPS